MVTFEKSSLVLRESLRPSRFQAFFRGQDGRVDGERELGSRERTRVETIAVRAES